MDATAGTTGIRGRICNSCFVVDRVKGYTVHEGKLCVQSCARLCALGPVSYHAILNNVLWNVLGMDVAICVAVHATGRERLTPHHLHIEYLATIGSDGSQATVCGTIIPLPPR